MLNQITLLPIVKRNEFLVTEQYLGFMSLASDTKHFGQYQSFKYHTINPFLANVPILYPLKTPQNLWFFWCFQGV